MNTNIILAKTSGIDLLMPEWGFVIWATVTFLLLLILLRKYAWKPILKAVNERELNIEESLKQAEKARMEMSSLKAENERILNEAREERSKILKEAKEAGERIRTELNEKANKEYTQKLEDATREIENQKQAALTEVKNTAATIAIEVAEKVLSRELDDKASQEQLATQLVEEFKLN